MHFSNRHFAAVAFALLVLAASGLAVIYKVQSGFHAQAELAAQASSRAQAAHQAGQRLMRMGLDLRAVVAPPAPPDGVVARHKASLQWQQDKLESVLKEMLKAAAPTEAAAIDKALAGAVALAPLYQAALAGGRQAWAQAPNAALLAAEAEAQQRLEDLQLALGRAALVEQGRLQEGSTDTAQVAVAALLGGVLALALALAASWWTSRHVEQARQALLRRQIEAQSASAGLLAQVNTHLSDSQAALRQSLDAARELSAQAERLATAQGRHAAHRGGETLVMRDPSPLALATQLIDRARRSAR